MFHWDRRQALHGGWQSRDTSKAFADYCAYVTKHMGDSVKHWMTTNEFICFTDLGYKIGQFAPGMKLPDAQVNQIRHHAILGHGLGVQAIRANTPSGTQVGLAENAVVYVPVMETDEHIEAARKATRDKNAPFLTTVLDGKYPESYLAQEGANAPKVEEGDMKAIGSPIRFSRREYLRAALCACGWIAERMGGRADAVVLSAHVLSLDSARSGMHLLGRAQCVRHLEGEGAGNLHHRKRHIFRRRADRGWACGGCGSRDVPAKSSDTTASRGKRGLPGEGLLPVEPSGQLRVGRRVQ